MMIKSHSFESDFWSISTTEHALPLRPVQVLKIALALAPSFDTAALAISYIIPNYNNVIFMNVENGANISVNLKERIIFSLEIYLYFYVIYVVLRIIRII